jgi:hypothetical protein
MASNRWRSGEIASAPAPFCAGPQIGLADHVIVGVIEALAQFPLVGQPRARMACR